MLYLSYLFYFRCRLRTACNLNYKAATLRVQSLFYLFIAFFTIYSRYLKRLISKRDGCVYLKQVLYSDGSLELI
jgi:hypothetical protein